jgi:dihydrofolate reductase
MKIALIAAVAENGAIGKDNALLWHLPADLQHFKRLTTGHVVVMGRKTFESIGKPLPNRTNIVVTRQPDYRAEGCKVVHSLEEAIDEMRGEPQRSTNNEARTTKHEQLFIIGGAELYEQALPLADKLYLTEVKASPEGDVFFPTINLTDWDELSRLPHPADERHAHAFEFVELERSGL